jgi:hypothetical protein
MSVVCIFTPWPLDCGVEWIIPKGIEEVYSLNYQLLQINNKWGWNDYLGSRCLASATGESSGTTAFLPHFSHRPWRVVSRHTE